ncbi:hypothetical protein M514_25398 [Trichuris suis]|uniref:Uncharacterized protein n=1 Tax=Trichuris suis TaxID=68888 RepID=A0A085MYU4_9BILA|nr:hypothetical protein M514_25398 [Trichuris suis]
MSIVFRRCRGAAWELSQWLIQPLPRSPPIVIQNPHDRLSSFEKFEMNYAEVGPKNNEHCISQVQRSGLGTFSVAHPTTATIAADCHTKPTFHLQ